VTLTIDGQSVVLTGIYTIGSWTLYYGTTAETSGAVVATASVERTICDFRVINEALSANARVYYYTDIEDNSGGIVLP
jgi:hypothetical protein